MLSTQGIPPSSIIAQLQCLTSLPHHLQLCHNPRQPQLLLLSRTYLAILSPCTSKFLDPACRQDQTFTSFNKQNLTTDTRNNFINNHHKTGKAGSRTRYEVIIVTVISNPGQRQSQMTV